METYGDPGKASPKKNAALAPVYPNSPGGRCSSAMKILASQHSPWGGTWATRFAVYVAPGIITSIALGRGPNHNLGPAEPGDSNAAPGSFLALFAEYRGNPPAVHFVFTATTRPANAPRGWGNAMATSARLVRSTSAGRTILSNGPDEYRSGSQATRWLWEFNRQFPA
jgi:hypothetical protein